jgi:hypothetical protein
MMNPPVKLRGKSILLASAMAFAMSPISAANTPKMGPENSAIIQLMPPLDQMFTLDVTSQQRTRGGKFITFTSRYSIQFSRAGSKLWVDAVLTQVHCDGPPAVSKAFEAAFAEAKGQAMRAYIAQDNGQISPVRLPAQDAGAVLKRLGASDLWPALAPETTQSGQPEPARTQASNQMWMADIAELLQFTNVDVSKLSAIDTPSFAGSARLENLPALSLLKVDNEAWTLQSIGAANADILTQAQFHIAMESGIITRSTTETRRRDVAGDAGLLSRKTMILEKSAKP